MVVNTERERVRSLLAETITLLCKNGLNYKVEFCVEALIGITLDKDDVFLVSIKETVKTGKAREEKESRRDRDVSSPEDVPSDNDVEVKVDVMSAEQAAQRQGSYSTDRRMNRKARRSAAGRSPLPSPSPHTPQKRLRPSSDRVDSASTTFTSESPSLPDFPTESSRIESSSVAGGEMPRQQDRMVASGARPGSDIGEARQSMDLGERTELVPSSSRLHSDNVDYSVSNMPGLPNDSNDHSANLETKPDVSSQESIGHDDIPETKPRIADIDLTEDSYSVKQEPDSDFEELSGADDSQYSFANPGEGGDSMSGFQGGPEFDFAQGGGVHGGPGGMSGWADMSGGAPGMSTGSQAGPAGMQTGAYQQMPQELKASVTAGRVKPVPFKRPVGRPRKRPAETSTSLPPLAKRQQVNPKTEPRDANPEPQAWPVIRGAYQLYTLKEKMEVIQHAKLHGIRPAAAHFKLPKSTVSDWMHMDFTKSRQQSKYGHEKRSGRPLSYGDDLDKEILQWVLVQQDLQIRVTVESLCHFAKALIGEKRPGVSFQASRNWGVVFMHRHYMALCCRESLSQLLPKELEAKITHFQSFIHQHRENEEYKDEFIINMDETPIFLSFAADRSVDSTSGTGQKTVHASTDGSKNRHFTLVLTVAASGVILPPMVIFKDEQSVKIDAPLAWILTYQENALMDEALMLRYIMDIHCPYTGKERSLAIMDSFPAHLTDEVKSAYCQANAHQAVIPAGCASKLQPLNVSISKTVKAHLRKSWSNYISSETLRIRQVNEQTMQKIKAPGKQMIVDWVAAALESIQPDTIKRSFKVCGISNNLNGSEDSLLRKDVLDVPEESDADVPFEDLTTQEIAMVGKCLKSIH